MHAEHLQQRENAPIINHALNNYQDKMTNP